jgi:hypothetical protein
MCVSSPRALTTKLLMHVHHSKCVLIGDSRRWFLRLHNVCASLSLFREEPVFCVDALIVVGEWFGGGVRFDDGVRWIARPFEVWYLWSSVVFSFIFRDFSVIWDVLCFYINEIPTPSQKKQ